MKSPTHFIPPGALKPRVPWLVYGWLSADDAFFVAMDGRRYPADLAVPITPFQHSPGGGREA